MPVRQVVGKKEIHRTKRRLGSIGGSGRGSVAPHTLLGVIHSDTAVNAPVEGALILGDSTPEWAPLFHPGAAGYAMVTDGTTWLIDQTPTWTGDHTWDDGDGDSPANHFITQSDDQFSMWAENDATPGDSDFVFKFPAADTDSQFIWRDSGDADVAYVDADGNELLEGHLAVGADSAVSADSIIEAQDTMTQVAGNLRAISARLDYDPGANSAAVAYGVHARVLYGGGNHAIAGTVYGARASISVDNGTAPTFTSVIGLGTSVDIEDATATEAAGVKFNTPLVDTGVITNGYGINVGQGGVGAGSIGTLRGLRIANINAGTTNWSIYSEGGDSWHAGDLKVGGAASVSAQLDVDQSSSSGAQPVLMLDQGDVSEQHIVVRINGNDVDFPAILQIEVTGSPTMSWDESDDRLNWNKDFGLTAGDMFFATAQGLDFVDDANGDFLRLAGGLYVPGDIQIGDVPGLDAQFVTMALSGDLANERVLTAGDGISLTDAGAGGAATVAVDLVAAWSGLEFSGGDLRIDLDATFNAWTGVHTHADDIVLDKNGGNSPKVYFTPANNDSLFIMADNDAIAGRADLRVALADAAGESFFYVRDSAGGFAMGVDSTGNLRVGGTITVPQYIIHNGDTDTYIDFTADEITLTAGATELLTVTEAATDTILFGAQADLNGNDLIIDTDGDTYLHESADDVISILIAGNEQYTLDATRLTIAASGGGDTVKVRTGGDLTVAAPIWMAGDGGISTEGSLYALIDSDNSGTDAVFEIAMNADKREVGVSGTALWTVYETNKQEMRLVGVAHGCTNQVEHTDTFFQVQQFEAAGGARILGAKDNAGVAGGAIVLRGLLDENADTTKTTAGRGIIELQGYQTNGADPGNVVADGNIVVFRTYASGAETTRFIFDTEGSAHADVEWIAFDEHDDVALLDALESSFGEFAEDHQADLERLKIATYDDRPGHAMVNFSRLAMLHTGAIRQMSQRLGRYEKALLELGANPALLEAQ